MIITPDQIELIKKFFGLPQNPTKLGNEILSLTDDDVCHKVGDHANCSLVASDDLH